MTARRCIELEGILVDGTTASIPSSGVISHIQEVTAVAWDGDTRLLWAFGVQYFAPSAVAFDPSSGRVVAEIWESLDGPYLASGYYDTHPTQTPELLVSGQCPGTVYVTLVDGTPGGRAFIASGTVDGPAVLPVGACGDVALGIADPVRRASLPINSYGIASTTFQATPGQCGAQLVQALDLQTCAPTQVRTVPSP